MRNKIKELIKKPSLKTAGIFASGNLIAAALSALGGIIVARWVTPEILGEFAKYRILTGYLGIGLVLVHAAYQRHYLFYLGKGDDEEARIIASTAKWWYVVFSWIGTIIFLILVIESLIQRDFRAAIGWGVQIPLIWMIIYGAYLQVLYRSYGDFRKLSYINILKSGASFLLLIFVKFFGFWGLAIRLFSRSLVELLMLRHYVPKKIKSTFDIKRLIGLARVSIPLQIPSYIDTYLLHATISFFILTRLGQRDLGVYVMALTIQGFIMIFNTSMSQIFTTKVSLRYGKTENVLQSLKYAILPTGLIFVFTLLISGVFAILIGPLMTNFTPKYIRSIPVLKIIVWQLPLATLKYPFVLFVSALWYKTVIILRLIKAVFCLAIIFIFSKSLISVALSLIIADMIFIFGGYGTFLYNKVVKKV